MDTGRHTDRERKRKSETGIKTYIQIDKGVNEGRRVRRDDEG